MLELLIEDEVIKQIRENRPNLEDVNTDLVDYELENSTSKIRSIDRRYVDYIRMAASGAVPLERIKPALKELEGSKKKLQERVSVLLQGGTQLDQAIQNSREKIQKGIWETSEFSDRLEILTTLLLRATIKQGHVHITVRG